MTYRNSAIGVIGAGLILLGAGQNTVSAQTASAASCFAIVPAQEDVAPAILIDKCSGKTWALARSWRRGHAHAAQAAYFWQPLQTDAEQTVAEPAPPSAQPPAGNHSHCFSFDGRKFCE